jgi:hypothetical protein
MFMSDTQHPEKNLNKTIFKFFECAIKIQRLGMINKRSPHGEIKNRRNLGSAGH